MVGSTTTVYIYSGNKPIVEYVNGSLSTEYIYAGSKLLATIAGGATTYHRPDFLSNRAETDASGTRIRTFGHFPFGETWYETGTADKFKFTSYEHDSGTAETGLDYAQFRSFASGQGRFMSADLLPGNLSYPQTLNRYAYAANDPISFVDPRGLNVFGSIWNWLNGSNDLEGKGLGAGLWPTGEPLPQIFQGGLEGFFRRLFTFTAEGCIPRTKLPGPIQFAENLAKNGVLPVAILDGIFHGVDIQTAGVGFQGSFAVGLGFSNKLGLGATGSMSGLVVTDINDQSAIIFNSLSVGFPSVVSNNKNWAGGAGAQAGIQIFSSEKAVSELSGFSVSVGGSYGPFAAETGSNGMSASVGVGVGAKGGLATSTGPTFVWPICKE